jgi:hypothetical protein
MKNRNFFFRTHYPVQDIDKTPRPGPLKDGPTIDEIPDWIIKYDKAGYLSAAGRAIRVLINKHTQLRGLVNDAFVAGRSGTSWEQFRKDHNF